MLFIGLNPGKIALTCDLPIRDQQVVCRKITGLSLRAERSSLCFTSYAAKE